jgi:hypothetical protein
MIPVKNELVSEGESHVSLNPRISIPLSTYYCESKAYLFRMDLMLVQVNFAMGPGLQDTPLANRRMIPRYVMLLIISFFGK